MTFSKKLEVKWSDCDPNGHLRGSAYADFCTHVRFAFLFEQGYSFAGLMAKKMGPVVLHDETDYLREVRLGETVEIDVRALGMSADGSKWKLIHRVLRADGQLAARHTLFGGWLDLEKRKLAPPPAELLEVMQQIERSEKYAEL